MFYQSIEWNLIDDLQRAGINTPDERDLWAQDRCEADIAVKREPRVLANCDGIKTTAPESSERPISDHALQRPRGRNKLEYLIFRLV
jgi:hypothetical protein